MFYSYLCVIVIRGVFQGHSLLLGDMMVYLKVIGACLFNDDISDFCHRYGVREQAVREVWKLQSLLVNTGTSKCHCCFQ